MHQKQSQTVLNLKFSGEACPQTPPSVHMLMHMYTGLRTQYT